MEVTARKQRRTFFKEKTVTTVTEFSEWNNLSFWTNQGSPVANVLTASDNVQDINTVVTNSSKQWKRFNGQKSEVVKRFSQGLMG